MAWKRREKKLSPEEAVALAKKDLKPFWFGTEPMVAAVKSGERVTVHPLDAEFGKKPWVLFFIDSTDFTGQRALELARTWHKRYHLYGLGFLGVFQPRYSFLNEPKLIKELIQRQRLGFACALDVNLLLTAAFNVQNQSKIILFNGGKCLFEDPYSEWGLKTEEKIQQFLRLTDPGLPLLPVYQGESLNRTFRPPLELGTGRGALFPKPGFAPGASGGFSTGKFHGERPKIMKVGDFFITGQWLQDGERIATSDPKASIGFLAPGKNVSIVAQSLSKRSEVAKINVELNEKPVFDIFAGEHIAFSDNGQSVVKVERGDLYHVLSGLPTGEREVTLYFASADKVPIALYGFRFSD